MEEIYLDNAATSNPKPDSVVQAVQNALTAINGNPGRSGHSRALNGARTVLACREALADFIGTDQPENMIFTFNCTDSLNLAIKGILGKGDHVVASALEHNSVLRVLHTLSLRGLIQYTIVRPEADGMVKPSAYKAALQPNTRLAIITQASNVTGALQPIAAITAEMNRCGVRTLIDGAQGIGHQPVNVKLLGCALYAFPGHKGLLGPQGTGGLYIAPGIKLNTFREGGTGSSSDKMAQPDEQPERYESGTVNLPGIAGLEEGVKFVRENRSQITQSMHGLTEQLLTELRAMDGVTVYSPADAQDVAGVVSFNVGDLSSSQVADQLAEANIAVRGGLHCAPAMHGWLGTMQRGAVRASVGWRNTADEIDRFLGTIRSMV